MHTAQALDNCECFTLNADDFCAAFDATTLLRMQQIAVIPWSMVSYCCVHALEYVNAISG